MPTDNPDDIFYREAARAIVQARRDRLASRAEVSLDQETSDLRLIRASLRQSPHGVVYVLPGAYPSVLLQSYASTEMLSTPGACYVMTPLGANEAAATAEAFGCLDYMDYFAASLRVTPLLVLRRLLFIRALFSLGAYVSQDSQQTTVRACLAWALNSGLIYSCRLPQTQQPVFALTSAAAERLSAGINAQGHIFTSPFRDYHVPSGIALVVGAVHSSWLDTDIFSLAVALSDEAAEIAGRHGVLPSNATHLPEDFVSSYPSVKLHVATTGEQISYIGQASDDTRTRFARALEAWQQQFYSTLEGISPDTRPLITLDSITESRPNSPQQSKSKHETGPRKLFRNL